MCGSLEETCVGSGERERERESDGRKGRRRRRRRGEEEEEDVEKYAAHLKELASDLVREREREGW